MRKSELVEKLFYLKGAPFSFNGRHMMRDIFDVDSFLTVLMMGRQIGKSTTIAYDTLTDTLLNPWFNTLYVAPRQDQVKVFSNDKLTPAIKYSPVFKKLMHDQSKSQNVFDKGFANNSTIYLRACFLSADPIRGISANKVVIDEVQDIIYKNVAIIEECLAGSMQKLKLYAGTPKTHNNTLAVIFAQSTGNEYLLKCSGCNTWNMLTMENIGQEGIICKKCKKKFEKPYVGEWVAMHPDANIVGFRLPQILSPTADWRDILHKLNNYPLYQFKNEVMAQPHDSGQSPITEADLIAACNPDKKCALFPTGTMYNGQLFLSVDWGHGDLSLASKKRNAPTGYTVATLGKMGFNNTYEVLWMKKYRGAESDPAHQINEIARIAHTQKVKAVFADYGDGFYHNIELRRKLNTIPLIELCASGNVREKLKWDPEVDSNKLTFHRTRCMSELFHDIKRKNVTFFNWKEFREFADDFLTIFIDQTSSTENPKMFYNHVLPDDAFHSVLIGRYGALFFKDKVVL